MLYNEGRILILDHSDLKDECESKIYVNLSDFNIDDKIIKESNVIMYNPPK